MNTDTNYKLPEHKAKAQVNFSPVRDSTISQYLNEKSLTRTQRMQALKESSWITRKDKTSRNIINLSITPPSPRKQPNTSVNFSLVRDQPKISPWAR